MVPTVRSRARILPSSATDASRASPDFSIRCRKALDAANATAPAGRPGQSILFWRASSREPVPTSLENAMDQKQSRANPRVDAAMKLLLPGAPDPEQVTPRGALRSMQRYRLHLGF